MKLTLEDVERYAPYHEWPEFRQGYSDYESSFLSCPYSADSVQAQAWDQGHECAMLQRRRTVPLMHETRTVPQAKEGCRPRCGRNLFSAISGTLKLSDQAATSMI
jgi:hypothetical protein